MGIVVEHRPLLTLVVIVNESWVEVCITIWGTVLLDVPEVEATFGCIELGFGEAIRANQTCPVAVGSQLLREGPLSCVEDLVRARGVVVDVTVLTGQHGSSGWSSNRVGVESIRELYTLVGKSIDVWGLN